MARTPASRAPAAQQLHVALFAVVPTVPLADLCEAAFALHDILDDAPAEFVMVAESNADALGLRWLMFLASRGPHYLLSPWITSLTYRLGPLEVALIDDRNKIFMYEHYGASREPELSVVSHRYMIAASRGEITATLPQTGLDWAALRAAERRRKAERSPAEHLAVTGYATAIDVGLLQLHPDATPMRRWQHLRARGVHYRLVHGHEEANRRAGISPRVSAAETRGLVNRVDYFAPYDRWPAALPYDLNRFVRD